MKQGLFPRLVLWAVMLFLLGTVHHRLPGRVQRRRDAGLPALYSLRWIVAVLQADEFRQAFGTSLEIGLLATVIALLLGVPVAYAMSRMPPPGMAVIKQVLTSPLIIPAMLVGLGLLRHFVLVIDAPVFLGLLIGHVGLLTPYAVRVVYSSLANLRVDIEEAAITLGATRPDLPAGGAQYPGRRDRGLLPGLRDLLQPGAGVAVPDRPRHQHPAHRDAGPYGKQLRSVHRRPVHAAGAVHHGLRAGHRKGAGHFQIHVM
jgi:ABC-type uncharacterized transport system permease subunit